MSLRRRDTRVEMVNAGGVLQLWRDVTGYRTADGHYLVISGEAGRKGEQLTMYLASRTHQPMPVRVLDSRPTMVDGAVRHQLRLELLEHHSLDKVETMANAGGDKTE